jgi:hypothetical protein
MTESSEADGVTPVLDGRVLENGLFTDPVSSAADGPVRRIARTKS